MISIIGQSMHIWSNSAYIVRASNKLLKSGEECFLYVEKEEQKKKKKRISVCKIWWMCFVQLNICGGRRRREREREKRKKKKRPTCDVLEHEATTTAPVSWSNARQIPTPCLFIGSTWYLLSTDVQEAVRKEGWGWEEKEERRKKKKRDRRDTKHLRHLTPCFIHSHWTSWMTKLLQHGGERRRGCKRCRRWRWLLLPLLLLLLQLLLDVVSVMTACENATVRIWKEWLPPLLFVG